MNDLQMARGAVEGGYNLAIGEPCLLQKYVPTRTAMMLQGPYHYPTMEGDPELLEQLRPKYPGKEVVVTVGAKQALAAAFYAYRKLGYVGVHHKAPYWPSYPTLAKMVGLVFNEDSPPNLTVTVNTSPNNPDGKTSDRACHIWDAVYASDAYNWNMYNSQSGWARAEPLSYQVAVYSASKLLGLSGARVGWLVTEDPAIAARAREYVELTTAGVSVPAQRIVAKALSDLAQDKGTAWTLRVTRDMMKNCNQFEDHVRPFVLRSCGTENHGVGMFAFFQVKPEHLDKFREALVTAKVTMVTGEACGMTEPGWFRMNLAQDCAYTEAALKQLRSAL